MVEDDFGTEEKAPVPVDESVGARLTQLPEWPQIDEELHRKEMSVSIRALARRTMRLLPGVKEDSIRKALERHRAAIPERDFIMKSWLQKKAKMDGEFDALDKLRGGIVVVDDVMKSTFKVGEETGFHLYEPLRALMAELRMSVKDYINLGQSLGVMPKAADKLAVMQKVEVEHKEKEQETMDDLLRQRGWSEQDIATWKTIPPCVIERSLQAGGPSDRRTVKIRTERGKTQEFVVKPPAETLDEVVDQINEKASPIPIEEETYQDRLEKAGVPEDQREYRKRGMKQGGLFGPGKKKT